MKLTKPDILVRSTLASDGTRRWLVARRTGLFVVPIGWPHHRKFRAWPDALRAANQRAITDRTFFHRQ